MLISVIIVAYDRKKFILEAIQSAINQTLPRERYEVIVIKNFTNESIDKFATRNGVINIISDEKSLSGKLYEAIRIAKGEIISFLEDDDRFYAGKLETVFNNFAKDKNLVYYHNSCVFEDDSGNELPFRFRSPDFNLSSISIRKSNIDTSALISMPDAVDTFFYFNAIDSGGNVLNDNVTLTHYRYHDSSSNYVGDFETTIEHKIDRFTFNIDNYNLIVKNLKTNNAIKLLLNRIITTKINVNIFCSLLHKKNIYNFSIKEIMFWLFYPIYYNRKFPFLFKSIKYIELIMPRKAKFILEKKIFAKTNAWP